MKNKPLFFAFFVALVSVLISWGCNTGNDQVPETSQFVIQVDSIQMPSVVKPGQSLKIQFYGTIGTDGC